MKVIGFDIEIADEFPSGTKPDLLRMERGLGVSVAAAAWEENLQLWASDPDKNRLTVAQAREMADWLIARQEAGDLIVTWNGAGFDFPVLARECESETYTRRLALLTLNHCDIAFAMLCSLGYMIGLDTAAKALRLSGKLPGMSGALAPILWSGTDRDLTDKEIVAISELKVRPGTPEARRLCERYVIQDAVTTFQIHRELVRERVLIWRTRKGTITKTPWVPVLVGLSAEPRLMTCKEALEIEPPDTSWMSNPRKRSNFIGWATDLAVPDLVMTVN